MQKIVKTEELKTYNKAKIDHHYFKIPLLQKLREHGATEKNPKKASNGFIEEVLKSKGYEMFQFGIQPSSKVCWLKRWVGMAMKDLKKKGYIGVIGRGVWFLTESGEKFLTEQEEKMEQQDSNKLFSEIVLQDPRLTQVLKDSSSCLSDALYTDRSKRCKACLFQKECSEKQQDNFNEFILQKIDQHLNPPQEEEEPEKKKIFRRTFVEISRKDPANCEECGKEIKEGETSLFDWAKDDTFCADCAELPQNVEDDTE